MRRLITAVFVLGFPRGMSIRIQCVLHYSSNMQYIANLYYLGAYRSRERERRAIFIWQPSAIVPSGRSSLPHVTSEPHKAAPDRAEFPEARSALVLTPAPVCS